MRRRQFAWLSIALLLVAAGGHAARADEAYVCDGGRIVYVKPGQLEHLKRTDPCIAGYYGLSVGDGTQSAHTNSQATSSELVEELMLGAENGLKLERDAMTALAGKENRDKPQPAAFVVPKPAPVKKIAPAAAPADYRNVVILNAAPGASAIYRHEK
jgi:hypothetical protein